MLFVRSSSLTLNYAKGVAATSSRVAATEPRVAATAPRVVTIPRVAATAPRVVTIPRVAQRSQVHHFRNVLLCGSSQDRYVPLHSARIELCRAAVKDSSVMGKCD